MGYAAKVLKDSITTDGARLTTFEVTFPRIVLAEFNTHRMLSRNSASSRAIPVLKRIKAVVDDPFVPESFGKNQAGMRAETAVDSEAALLAQAAWFDARDAAVRHAHALAKLDVHKQLANRLLEPFLWHTVIVSATEWENFDALRCSAAAQPEIRKPAEMMRDARAASTPERLRFGQWHTPMLDEGEALQLLAQDFSADDVLLVAVGRCARVSYLTHDGIRDPRADVELAKRLRSSGHMSPFEHVAEAYPIAREDFIGNFRGWKQYRKTIPNEDNFAKVGA
jgi:hypothetical protein